MRWLVDIDAAVSEGLIGAEAGETLKTRARTEGLRFGVDLLAVGGIATVMLGLLSLFPTPGGLAVSGLLLTIGATAALLGLDRRYALPSNAAAVIGLASLAAGLIGIAMEAAESPWPAVWIGLGVLALGLAVRMLAPRRLRVLAGWMSVFGAAAHLGGVFSLEGSPDLAWAAMLDAAAVALLLGVVLDIRLFTGLAVFALAGTLAAMGYRHATYSLAIYEPTLAILMMGTVAAVGALVASQLAERFARHGRIAGLIALIWANFAFWIGSLWGDRVGEHMFAPHEDDFADRQSYLDARTAFRADLVAVPELTFVVGWAAVLLAVAAWAALSGRRSMLNAAVTFGAIHFYTQWFERLETQPLTVIGAGLIAILAAWATKLMNDHITERAKRAEIEGKG